MLIIFLRFSVVLSHICVSLNVYLLILFVLEFYKNRIILYVFFWDLTFFVFGVTVLDLSISVHIVIVH